MSSTQWRHRAMMCSALNPTPLLLFLQALPAVGLLPADSVPYSMHATYTKQ
jgi:hypothetical protein